MFDYNATYKCDEDSEQSQNVTDNFVALVKDGQFCLRNQLVNEMVGVSCLIGKFRNNLRDMFFFE